MKAANGSRTNDPKRREEILQAGILSGSLYHHFESKDQMVEEILLAGTDRQDTKRLWISVVRKGVEQGAFRDDLDADVAVRAMFDAVLPTIRWFPPLGRSSPLRIGSQRASFFIDGLRRGAGRSVEVFGEGGESVRI